jgi:hypothetical protein
MAVAAALGATVSLATGVPPAGADIAALQLASRGIGGQPADGPPSSPSISADGRWVAFASTASNLVPGLDGQRHVYAWDRYTDALIREDFGVDGAPLPSSSAPSLSSDGQWLAFCGPSGTGTTAVYLRNRLAGTTTEAGEALEYEGPCPVAPSVTADGEKVAFWRWAPDSADSTKVVIWDRISGTSTPVINDVTTSDFLLSLQLAGAGATLGYSDYFRGSGSTTVIDVVTGSQLFSSFGSAGDKFSLSDDGTIIAYQRTDLFGPEPPHVFVRDLTTGADTQVDQDPEGGGQPSLSPDGRFVGYWSTVSRVLDRSTGNRARGPQPPVADLSNAAGAGGPVAVLVTRDALVQDDTNGLDDIYAAQVVPDGPPPTVDVGSDVSVTEGSPATVTVTLSAPSGEKVTVDWATVDGTAIGGEDFDPQSGQFVFWPGDTREAITVSTRDDALDEFDETFSVALSSPYPAVLGRSAATVLIVDNDPAPALTLDNPSVFEGYTGDITPLTFTVRLSAVSGRAVSVQARTADGSARVRQGDYLPVATTLTIPAGATSGTVVVPVLGDSLRERNERLYLDLSSATNATIQDAQGVGTILNDD